MVKVPASDSRALPSETLENFLGSFHFVIKKLFQAIPVKLKNADSLHRALCCPQSTAVSELAPPLPELRVLYVISGAVFNGRSALMSVPGEEGIVGLILHRGH